MIRKINLQPCVEIYSNIYKGKIILSGNHGKNLNIPTHCEVNLFDTQKSRLG
ncbi:MAG: hypothetical protein ACXAB8_03200 [Promethearchaeota archaeon]